MAKEIIWSQKAQNDRKEILSFWIENNSSNKYSLDLNRLLEESIYRISIFPKIGKTTSDKKIRVKTVKEYLVFYELYKDKILILTIWDTRRNPKEINF